MICPECNKKIERGKEECPHCGYPVKSSFLDKRMCFIRIFKAFLVAVAAISLLLAVIFSYKGFNKKNRYYNLEYSTSLNENAYVGGDAYNYIINGTYFTGYLTIAASMYVVSVVTCVAWGYLNINEMNMLREEEYNGFAKVS